MMAPMVMPVVVAPGVVIHVPAGMVVHISPRIIVVSGGPIAVIDPEMGTSSGTRGESTAQQRHCQDCYA